MIVLSLLAGLVLLVVGGEGLVRGSVAVARRLHVSDFLIGLVLVGFGTSMPEMMASVSAALAGSPGVAVGNVVGSNIANALLIGGIAALICPIVLEPKAYLRDGLVMLGASLLCAGALIALPEVSRPVGAVFLALLISFLVWTWLAERRNGGASKALHEGEAEQVPPGGLGVWAGLGLALGGLAVLIVGAQLLVTGAVDLARLLGVSEAVIGLTIVAVGTSLPELTASVVSALRRNPDVAIGNIIGSNLFNIFGILGATALIAPLTVPAEIIARDIWWMLAASLALLVFTFTAKRLTRLEGALLAAAYAGYLGVLILL